MHSHTHCSQGGTVVSVWGWGVKGFASRKANEVKLITWSHLPSTSPQGTRWATQGPPPSHPLLYLSGSLKPLHFEYRAGGASFRLIALTSLPPPPRPIPTPSVSYRRSWVSQLWEVRKRGPKPAAVPLFSRNSSRTQWSWAKFCTLWLKIAFSVL